METEISLSYNSTLFQVSLSVATMGPLALLSNLGGVLGLMLGLGVLQIIQLADSKLRKPGGTGEGCSRGCSKLWGVRSEEDTATKEQINNIIFQEILWSEHGLWVKQMMNNLEPTYS